jgi:cytochrome P450
MSLQLKSRDTGSTDNLFRFIHTIILYSQQQRTGHLSHDEVVQIVFLLLVAGNATVVNMIALVR